ncbi:MAG: hypothetical protein GF308_11250 [Candidatus Heimdallarchaeota archaeon]|nr:hypothetical protein [Candidatus Heimdallarchaeota archaeon]
MVKYKRMEDRVLASSYRKVYQKIKKKSIENLEFFRVSTFRGNDHGVHHSERIFEHLDQLIKSYNVALSIDEVFYLASAIWLHDVGLAYKPHEYLPDWKVMRTEHHLRSNEFLTDNFEAMDLDFSQISPLSTLILGHRGEKESDTRYKIGSIPKYWPERPRENEEQIRLRLLVALMRLGDVCDADYRRAPISKQKALSVSREQIEHWRKHQHIDRLYFDEQNKQIIMEVCYRQAKIIDPKTKEEQYSLKEIGRKDVKRVSSEIWSDYYPSRKVLAEAGIVFDRIKVIPTGEHRWTFRDYSITFKIPSKLKKGSLPAEDLTDNIEITDNFRDIWKMIVKQDNSQIIQNKCRLNVNLVEKEPPYDAKVSDMITIKVSVKPKDIFSDSEEDLTFEKTIFREQDKSFRGSPILKVTPKNITSESEPQKLELSITVEDSDGKKLFSNIKKTIPFEILAEKIIDEYEPISPTKHFDEKLEELYGKDAQIQLIEIVNLIIK